MSLLRSFSWALVFLFLVAGLVIPIGSLIANASVLSGFFKYFFATSTLTMARITFEQALLSASLSVLMGFPLSLWISNSRTQVSRNVLALPFSVPTLLVAFSWMGVFGRSGIFSRFGEHYNLIYSFQAVILAHAFLNIPWAVLSISESAGQIPVEENEAALNLGASFLQRFRSVHWPYLKLPTIGCFLQIYNFCAMSFTIVLLLGGGPPIQTLEVGIFERIRFGELQLGAAVALGIWQLLLGLIPWIWFVRLKVKILRPTYTRCLQPKRFGILSLLPFLFVVPYVFPFVSLRFLSFTYAHGLPILTASLGSAVFSLFLAFAASLGSLFFAGCFLVSRFPAYRFLAQLPSGISIVALGLSFYVAYSRWFNSLSGSLFPLIFLQILLFLPFAYRWLEWLYLTMNRQLLDAARNLGAHRIQAFYSAEWPRWRTSIGYVVAMISGASMGELAAVSLFYSERWVPLPTLIFRLASQYRFEEAEVVSAVLLLLCFGISLLLGRNEKWEKKC